MKKYLQFKKLLYIIGLNMMTERVVGHFSYSERKPSAERLFAFSSDEVHSRVAALNGFAL